MIDRGGSVNITKLYRTDPSQAAPPGLIPYLLMRKRSRVIRDLSTILRRMNNLPGFLSLIGKKVFGKQTLLPRARKNLMPGNNC